MRRRAWTCFGVSSSLTVGMRPSASALGLVTSRFGVEAFDGVTLRVQQRAWPAERRPQSVRHPIRSLEQQRVAGRRCAARTGCRMGR